MLNIGIIGAGRIGKVHLESISNHIPNATVVAVADPFMNDETEAFIKGFGVEKIYTDYKKIIEDADIDAVMVCSSTDTHAPISIEAIHAGKHVFCEKPLANTVDKILEIADALQAHPEVKFQVGFNRRFDHNFAAIRKAYDEGKIGDAQILKITSRDPQAPPVGYCAASIFLDMTIHDFDMACFLTDSDVEEVYVYADALIHPEIREYGDFDTAIISMKMKNGALAVIDNSRQAMYGYDQRAELFGSKGMVATANDTQSTAVLSTADGITGEKPLYFFLERYMGSFAQEVREFCTAIETDTQPPVGIHAGLQSVKIALAAEKSATEHRPVALAEITA